jgi:hypothetical protein
MIGTGPAYGLWDVVILNVVVFVVFAFSFARPTTPRDWRSFGAFTAFLVALFTEMYGFPLTMYLLSGWIQRRYPGLDVLSHDAGHLWETLLGWQGGRPGVPRGPTGVQIRCRMAGVPDRPAPSQGPEHPRGDDCPTSDRAGLAHARDLGGERQASDGAGSRGPDRARPAALR